MVVLEGKRSRKFGQHFAVGHLGSRVEPSRGRHGAEVSSQDQVSVHLQQQQPLIEPNGPKKGGHGHGARPARGARHGAVVRQGHMVEERLTLLVAPQPSQPMPGHVRWQPRPSHPIAAVVQ